MAGGMIQRLDTDGTWQDCFPVGDKTHNAAHNVAAKYRTQVRVINRKGHVLYKTDRPEPRDHR